MYILYYYLTAADLEDIFPKIYDSNISEQLQKTYFPQCTIVLLVNSCRRHIFQNV